MPDTYQYTIQKAYCDVIGDGLVGIMNQSYDGSIIEVRRIAISYVIGDVPLSASAGLTMLSLNRITAASGGSNGSVTKLDTNDADFPSQVSFLINPLLVTESTLQRRQILIETIPTAGAAISFSIRHFNGALGDYSTNAFIHDDFSDNQAIILREGEGFGIKRATAQHYPRHMLISFQVRETSGGEMYICRNICLPTINSGDYYFTFLNGSGSGKIYEIREINIIEVGTSTLVAQNIMMRLAFFQPAFLIGSRDGTDEPALAMDPGMPDPPSGIRVVKGPFLARPYPNFYDWPHHTASNIAINAQNFQQMLKIIPVFPTVPGPIGTAINVSWFNGMEMAIWEPVSGEDGIMLRSNEAIGILQHFKVVSYSSYIVFNVSITLNVWRVGTEKNRLPYIQSTIHKVKTGGHTLTNINNA